MIHINLDQYIIFYKNNVRLGLKSCDFNLNRKGKKDKSQKAFDQNWWDVTMMDGKRNKPEKC